MKTILQAGMTIMGGCAMAAVFWLVLAAPGFVSEQDTLTHAVALARMASR